jgi:acyl-CoA hydrolase
MQDDNLGPRPVRDSQSEMAEIVLPNDTNPLGALLGGRLMHWIDLAGAMAAHRHSRNYVVTASVDHIDFLVPVRVGDLVILRSSVNRVFQTSMEVGVKVYVENYIADTAQHVGSAYLTFVAVDAAGKHLKVAAIIPETDEQQRRYTDAGLGARPDRFTESTLDALFRSLSIRPRQALLIPGGREKVYVLDPIGDDEETAAGY